MEQYNGSATDNGARYARSSSGPEQKAPDRDRQRPGMPLQGKVALIIAGLKGTEHALAVEFAERGIDVALVYSGDRYEQALSLKRDVEERDRGCLLINGDRAGNRESEAFGRHVVATILDTLGRLDIFVSLRTAPSDLAPLSEQEATGNGALRRRLFPEFAVMKAALDQIVN